MTSTFEETFSRRFSKLSPRFQNVIRLMCAMEYVGNLENQINSGAMPGLASGAAMKRFKNELEDWFLRLGIPEQQFIYEFFAGDQRKKEELYFNHLRDTPGDAEVLADTDNMAAYIVRRRQEESKRKQVSNPPKRGGTTPV